MPLTHGWVPVTVQLVAVAVLLLAIGWRSRRWRCLWVPAALLVGAALAASVYWYVAYQGLADDPAPFTFWVWITLTGLAAGVLVLGWRGIRWWRRGVSALALPLCLLCVALALNIWVGYFPTVQSAWDRLTSAPLPGQTDWATVTAMQRRGVKPSRGNIVQVTIPDDGSGFKHRTELVYLPPVWYATNPPPRLPVVMMIGPEFGHPNDWLQAGRAQETVDGFAAAHGGDAPILVFVDSSGAFSNDTECVNGTRGNAADHLTKDVVPYMISQFGVSSDPANWGIVGWSSGGTCALTLTVMHPELFRAFVDIDGQFGPNAGTEQQTIERLFGGDADAWAAFDPRTVITKHGLYTGISGWFAVSVDTPTVYRAAGDNDSVPAGQPDQDPDSNAYSEDHAAVAGELCQLASSHGIECVVVGKPGKHDFSSGASAFAAALPWLAGKIGTPGAPKIAMPGAPPLS
jgi:S-formylglutathione hydrolase FrmB